MSVASIIARASLPEELGEERLAELYPRVMSGDYLGAGALSEPDAGSDLASLTCHAQRDGDDWMINGQKMWCTNADDAAFIPAALPHGAHGSGKSPARHRLVLYREGARHFPGRDLSRQIDKIGYHGWYTFALSFDDFRLPSSALMRSTGAFENAAG